MAKPDLKDPRIQALNAELEAEGYYWKQVENSGTEEEWFLFDPLGTEVTFEEAVKRLQEAKSLES